MGGVMSQIAIYLDKETEKKLDRLAKKEGKSRSSWVKEAILEKMQTSLPETWFALWGSWEDNRSSEEILKDIDEGYLAEQREELK